MATMAEESEIQAEEIEFIKKGQVTIPKRMRDAFNIVSGGKGTIIPIDGAFLIVPVKAETPALLDALRLGLGTQDMTLEEMISELREIRDNKA